MKELSIEEKAKAYDEAIERAKDMLSYKEVRQEDIEYLFPELKESEEERIRKDIIVLVKDWWDRVNKDNISTKEQMIAWLQKQGEQKPVEWSEEDKKMLEKVIDNIECPPCTTANYKPIREMVDWLNFLKERYAWKPSDDQIEALESATENCAYSEYQDCLRELIEQLKKLRVK